MARQIAACLQHRTPREMYNTAVQIQLAVPDAYVSSAFKAALPRSFRKAMAFLAAEYGSLSYVYDRCPECPFVFRGEFQDREHCPRCCSRRYHITGTHRLAVARLLVCPLAEWVKYLWRHPEFARCSPPCTCFTLHHCACNAGQMLACIPLPNWQVRESKTDSFLQVDGVVRGAQAIQLQARLVC